jgi:hypothetical protein
MSYALHVTSADGEVRISGTPGALRLLRDLIDRLTELEDSDRESQEIADRLVTVEIRK